MRRMLREIPPTLALAVPIIIGQVSQMLIGITDTVMIGHVGTVPLAAAAFGSNVFNVFYVVGIGLMLPVAVFVSHAHGARHPEECGEYLRHGLALAVGFGLIESVIIGVLGFNLHAFGQTPEVLAAVNPFFGIIGVSITPVLLFLALRQFAEAMGRPWLPVAIMLGGVGLNAFLNWVLIYGRLGSPALGLTGAGIATLISRVLVAAVLFEWVRRDPLLNVAFPRRWLVPLSGNRMREMLRLGVPSSGMLLFESGAFTAAAVMVGWLGAVPLAAHQIALSCAGTTFMFVLGLSMAAGMRTSSALGAGEHARLRPIGYGALCIGALIAGVCMIFYLVAHEIIAGWFVQDPAVILVAGQLLIVAALFQFVDGSQVIGAGVLRGLKDVRVPTVITFIAYWGIAIGGGYHFGIRREGGAVAIWALLAVGLAFAAVLLVWRFHLLSASSRLSGQIRAQLLD